MVTTKKKMNGAKKKMKEKLGMRVDLNLMYRSKLDVIKGLYLKERTQSRLCFIPHLS